MRAIRRFLILGFLLIVPGLAPAADSPWPAAVGAVHPRVSPDGQSIAMSYQGAIWLYQSDLRSKMGPIRAPALVPLSRGEGWDIEPAWSPDGQSIIFLRTRNFSGGELKRIAIKTGEEIPLPRKINSQGKLEFSPDGKRILSAFIEGRPGWFDLESGELTTVPLGPEDDDRFRRKRIRFTLSRDGASILYVVHRDEPDEQGGNRGPQAAVWKCDSDGSNATELFEWPARIYDLCPDGNGEGFIAVTDLGTAHNDLWHIPFEDPIRKARRLTHSLADEDRPSVFRGSVSPVNDDSTLLVYSSNRGGATAIESLLNGAPHPSPFGIGNPLTPVYHDGGTLSVRCLDPVGSKTEPATARITILRKGGKFHAPPGSLYRMASGQGHFYAAESGEFNVPAGDYRIIARRGPEYRPVEKTVSLEAAQKQTVELKLERWINLAERGWYSGENHVHANYGYGEWYNTPESILRQCLGENLNVCNAVIANSDGDAIFDREFFRGQVDPRSTDDCLVYWGQEFRSTIWGHMTLSSITQLTEPIMTGFPGTTNPFDVPTNADVAHFTTDRGGVIGYTHPASNFLDLYDQPYAAKGLPVDAALKRVALMDVHGHTYRGSMQLWYRLMNCGLPVVASSGTDVFLNRVRSLPPGFARTYVHLPDGLTYSGWTKGQQEGRSFITNGPMLRLEINGKQGMGHNLSLESPGKVAVRARAQAQFPMDRAELVHNGKVVKSLFLSEAKLAASFDGEINISESGWLALRAHGPAHSEVIKEPDAHTNPAWITVAGKPNSMAATDAAFFLKWIDRLQADVEKRDRIPNERLREHVRGQLDGARLFYRKLLPKN